MNNNDRNTRTLVICFVIAVMSLVSLKFVYIGQNLETISTTQVLGETVQLVERNEIETGEKVYQVEIIESN